jgi:hypothetical protein
LAGWATCAALLGACAGGKNAADKGTGSSTGTNEAEDGDEPAEAGYEVAPGQESVDEAMQDDANPSPGHVKELTTDLVRETVRSSYPAFLACYKTGLERDPKIRGTIRVRLAIGDDGKVLNAQAPIGSDADNEGGELLTDELVVNCVLGLFYKIRFHSFEGGIHHSIYPVVLKVE